MAKISIVESASLAENAFQIVFANQTIEMHGHFVAVQRSINDGIAMLKQHSEAEEYKKGIATSQNVRRRKTRSDTTSHIVDVS